MFWDLTWDNFPFFFFFFFSIVSSADKFAFQDQPKAIFVCVLQTNSKLSHSHSSHAHAFWSYASLNWRNSINSNRVTLNLLPCKWEQNQTYRLPSSFLELNISGQYSAGGNWHSPISCHGATPIYIGSSSHALFAKFLCSILWAWFSSSSFTVV